MSDPLVDEFEVDGLAYPSKLVKDLHIDRMNLSLEYELHSERFNWYATAYELALDKERRLKAELGRAYAHVDVKARENLKAAGIRVSEKKVENVVITHELYREVQDQYFDAQRMVGLIKAARDAMIHKKDCLVSLGANLRAEMASDPSLLQDQYRKQKREQKE